MCENQMAVWAIGVFTCILASYLSAATERQMATGTVYDYQPLGRQVDTDEDDGGEQEITFGA
eukprot:SAG11_NODE_33007_length_279_cov_1.305556_1_plen_61_part_01